MTIEFRFEKVYNTSSIKSGKRITCCAYFERLDECLDFVKSKVSKCNNEFNTKFLSITRLDEHGIIKYFPEVWNEVEHKYEPFVEKEPKMDPYVVTTPVQDFTWAMDRIKEGKKVRRKSWNYTAAYYCGIIMNNVLMNITNNLSGNAKFTHADMIANDWELVDDSIVKLKDVKDGQKFTLPYTTEIFRKVTCIPHLNTPLYYAILDNNVCGWANGDINVKLIKE